MHDLAQRTLQACKCCTSNSNLVPRKVCQYLCRLQRFAMLCAYSAKLYILNTVLRRLRVPRRPLHYQLSALCLKSMHDLAQRTLNCERANVTLSLAARTLPCSQQQCAPLHLPFVRLLCGKLLRCLIARVSNRGGLRELCETLNSYHYV